MGEYAKYKGVEIKIGTCENMYYLRYEDRDKVTKLHGSLNPATEKNLFWRLPFPDEDKNGAGNYENYQRGYRLVDGANNDFPIDETMENSVGSFQMSHPSGLLLSVPCHHGAKLPVAGEGWRVHWNGKSHAIELAFLKNTPEGVLPVIRCRHCGDIWRCDWDEVLPYIQDKKLYARLKPYNNGVKAA